MLAWEKVSEATQKVRSPKHIMMWSDGAPNQFKYSLPLWFLSRLKVIGKYDKVWWNFFASCHGKGMQDAAGAWVKTRVARAILLGGMIKTVHDFFMYCVIFLTTQAESQEASRGNQKAFTSSRKFYHLKAAELANYRANVVQVDTWSLCRLHHFFWAGMVADQVGRKWVGCKCRNCLAEQFHLCSESPRFLVNGDDKNKPKLNTFEVSRPQQRTMAEDIAVSYQVPLMHVRICDVLCCSS